MAERPDSSATGGGTATHHSGVASEQQGVPQSLVKPPPAAHKWRVLRVGCKVHGCSERALEHAYGKCFDHKDPRLEQNFGRWYALQNKKTAAEKLTEARKEAASSAAASSTKNLLKARAKERAVVTAREACETQRAAIETQRLLNQMHLRNIMEQQTVLAIKEKQARHKKQHASQDALQGSKVLQRVKTNTTARAEARVADAREKQFQLRAQEPLKQSEDREKVRRVRKQQAKLEALLAEEAAAKQELLERVKQRQHLKESQVEEAEQAQCSAFKDQLRKRRVQRMKTSDEDDVAEFERNAQLFEEMQYIFAGR